MSNENLDRVEQLFQEAADLPLDQRGAFLQGACGSDRLLRQRVEELLRRFEEDGSLLRPTVETAGGTALSEGPGSIIGRYKLLEVVGEGGFGVVYMAEQQEPVIRRVALKIIKQGMDTREVVARFEAERQALALMDHQNIARVLDGGATDTGRPFFVMELVRGVTLTEYCDTHRLPPAERLQLFLEVCAAVQHAHQKGVIHRDLKPSNVLVTLHDGEPVAKVIDFGIAKAMHTRLTEKTLFTRFQQFVGTPAYMSPEQAELSGLDVDTRTDIYSLGVLLYELLTGSTPFDTQALFEASFSEMQRVIREQPPERPSLRISTSGSAQVAALRRLDLRELSRRLQGDLDWIVLKTLEKERNRRYASAGELADDLRRHLRQEPVLASPPSQVYRLRKFVARNRGLVIAGTAVLLALLLGIFGTSLGMLEASRQRDTARREADNVQNLTDYLVGLLSLADPQFAMAPDVSVRQLMERAATDAGSVFAAQPEAEARVRSTLGCAYLSLGEHRAAERELERAVGLLELLEPRNLGAEYAALWAMTNVAFKLERPDAFAWAGRARRAGHEHVRAFHALLAQALDRFHDQVEQSAHLPGREGLEEASEVLLPECLDLAHEVLAPGDPLWIIVAETCMAAGYWVWYTPHESFGVEFFQTALSIQERQLKPGHPKTAESLALLVDMLNRAGRSAEAGERIQRAVRELRKVLAAGNFQLAFVESMWGENLSSQGDYAAAEKLLLPAHEVILANVPRPTDFYAIASFTRLVTLYDRWQRPQEAGRYRDQLTRHCAESPFFASWPLLRIALGPEDKDLVAALDELHEAAGGFSFSLRWTTREPPDLQADWPALLASSPALQSPDRPAAALAARCLLFMTFGLDAASDDPLLPALMRRSHEILRAWRTVIPLDLACAAARLSEIEGHHGRSDTALVLAREALECLPESTAARNWFGAILQARVALRAGAAGLSDEAEPFLREARRIVAEQLGEEHFETAALDALLAEFQLERHRHRE